MRGSVLSIFTVLFIGTVSVHADPPTPRRSTRPTQTTQGHDTASDAQKVAAMAAIPDWKLKIAVLEARIDGFTQASYDNSLYGVGLVQQLNRIEEVLNGEGSVGRFEDRASKLEEKLGIVSDPQAGSQTRILRLAIEARKHLVAKTAQERKNRSWEERAKHISNFLSEMEPKKVADRSHGTRLAKLRGEFPDVVKEDGPPIFVVQKLEQHFKIAPAVDTTFDDRLAAVEAFAKEEVKKRPIPALSMDAWLDQASLRLSAIENRVP